jgi:hypothetical protein
MSAETERQGINAPEAPSRMSRRTLGEVASVVRSKNAGPFHFTFDIMFSDQEVFTQILRSGQASRERLRTPMDFDPRKFNGRRTSPRSASRRQFVGRRRRAIRAMATCTDAARPAACLGNRAVKAARLAPGPTPPRSPVDRTCSCSRSPTTCCSSWKLRSRRSCNPGDRVAPRTPAVPYEHAGSLTSNRRVPPSPK